MIAEIGDRNPVSKLLRAANETVLGRSLRFSSSNGKSLTLDVAGRRILRLSAVDGLQGAEACLAAEALEDEHKDDLIKLIQAVAAPEQELSVISGPIGIGADGVSVGLPVALVADLMLIELNELTELIEVASENSTPVEEPTLPDAPPDSVVDDTNGGLLGKLVAGIGSTLVAWLILGGEDDGKTDGPEEMVSHLHGFLADEAEALSVQLDSLSNVPGSPICLILGATLIEGHSLICARDEAGMMLGVIEGDCTKTVLSAWKSAIRK